MLPNRQVRAVNQKIHVADNHNLITAPNSNINKCIDTLPQEFVNSLKILFDILDGCNRGYVLLTDIEAYWQSEGVKVIKNSLPEGVLHALREIALPNGTLSFDRFVMGLKFALLESDSKDLNTVAQAQVDNDSNMSQNHAVYEQKGQVFRNNEGEKYHAEEAYRSSKAHEYGILIKPNMRNKPIMATVKPNNVLDPVDNKHSPNRNFVKNENDKSSAVLQPLKTRNIPKFHAEVTLDTQSSIPPPIPPRHSSRNVIRHDLKRWQQEQLGSKIAVCYGTSRNQSESDLQNKKSTPLQTYENIEDLPRSNNDGNRISASHAAARAPNRPYTRRHTLTNGIDNNMIKRMRQLGEEKDILLRGLEGTESAMMWYQQQIGQIEDKLQTIGHSTHAESTVELNRERLDLLMSRVLMINRHLSALVDASTKSLPHHMNLATRRTALTRESWVTLNDENKRLNRALSDQNHRISKLEVEKCSLLRQLFGITANDRASYSDTTLL